jgi:hypothetical protein
LFTKATFADFSAKVAYLVFSSLLLSPKTRKSLHHPPLFDFLNSCADRKKSVFENHFGI